MARIRGRPGYKPKTYNKTEVFQWLKTLPKAPEFHPTPEEFQDPIGYIHKIEKEASSFGICKIIPPLPLPSRKTTNFELNKSFLACSASSKGESRPAFTTRVQHVGLSLRKDHPVIRPVRESGESCTLSEFEAKARAWEKSYFKNCSMIKGVLNPLELETLYWDAQAGKAIEVEYGNDMPGSAFVELDRRRTSGNVNVGDTEWNVRGAARAKGCPLRFVKDDIPGVTSPMVYMGMMFSWFAWHVEDHDFHSLNYLHMGDAKTWYGVPSDSAIAFEEAIRNHGYEGKKNFISYATLAQKTTVMSPEVILDANIPCCRLVQNAGEFVVTFPRAYHSGFSHGFNCAESSNIGTPEWLRYASKAAIRRAAVDCPLLVSHNQLLYDLAMSLSSRVPMSVEPRNSRLEERKKGDGEYLVKELFVQDVVHNTNLLHKLAKGSAVVLLPHNFIEGKFPKSRDSNTIPLYSKNIDFSFKTTSKQQKIFTEENVPARCERSADTGFLSCVTCGDLCFACAAIIRPSQVAVRNLMSANYGNNEGSCSYLFGFPKDTSSLSLLALTYGDATDSETESGEVSPVCGLDSDDSRSSHMSSSRSNVFCLQHAFEVEQKLLPLGGVHMLLLCHPDYPKFQAEAEQMADDLGANHLWSNIDFRKATGEDSESFNSGLNSEVSTHGNADWSVKLGVNLSHSAGLSRSTIDSNQIPNNSVLYKAFGHRPSADISPTKINRKRSVVAGKWCSNVVADGVQNEQEKLDLSKTVAKQQVPEPDVMPEIMSKRQTADFSSESSKSTLKRKRMADTEPTSLIKSPEIQESVTDAPRGKCDIQYQRRHKLKKKVIQEKSLQPEKDQDQRPKQLDVSMEEKLEEGGPSSRLRPRTGKQPKKNDPALDKAIGRCASTKHICNKTEYACKTEGCTMNFGSKEELVLHNKKICSVEGCRKKFVSHKYLLQHQRVHLDDRPLKCSWKNCSKTFKWAWAQTEHMRVHTGARPYVCGETGCGKTFRFVSDFSRHKRTTGHMGKLQESEKRGKKKT
ncbi:lysine-specific demethylase JMJ705-like isoform X2 [Apium graveolens]|uniref:lysine-specific demethylase JMJ705-like isoform X2 n=1 Tax=Apium graveolens TaxID=4045 RepID=UPI003D7A1939